jgi:hypothetical protein
MRRRTFGQKLLDENVTADEQVTRCAGKVLCAPLILHYNLANGDTGSGGAACPFIESLGKLGWKNGNVL